MSAVILAALAYTVVATIQGFALTYLWEWFVVPLGVTPISIPWAIGLTLVGSLVCTTRSFPKEEKDLLVQFIYSLLLPTVTLFIGYVLVTFFMTS